VSTARQLARGGTKHTQCEAGRTCPEPGCFSSANVQDEAPDAPMTTQRSYIANRRFARSRPVWNGHARPRKWLCEAVRKANSFGLAVDLPTPIPTIRPLCSSEFALCIQGSKSADAVTPQEAVTLELARVPGDLCPQIEWRGGVRNRRRR